MTLQQWLFSFKGRIGRRDFWVWIGLWLVAMALLFILVCLLWPTSAVIVKRLHDRGKSGLWALFMILAWMLLAGNWAVLGGIWQWVVGRFVPTVIMVMLLLDLGAFIGTPGENKYGKDTLDVKYR